MKKFKQFVEDFGGAVAANSAGSGQIAGIGVPNPTIPNQAEPGGRKAILRKNGPLRRSSPVLESLTRIFDVTPEKFYDVRIKRHKHPMLDDYMGDDVLGESVKAFAQNNPQFSIILRNSNSRELFYIR